jgi:hypothetical protein
MLGFPGVPLDLNSTFSDVLARTNRAVLITFEWFQ